MSGIGEHRGGEDARTENMLKVSDEQVAESALGGDGEAFGELVRRWEGRIFRLAYGMLGCAEDAREATQETFFAAYRNLANFRGEARVSSWLHRIAVNQCISRQRRARVRPEIPLPDGEDAVFESLLRTDEGQAVSPADTAERNERAEAVRRAVMTLPPELREVILLKEFEEMTFQQISQTLGVPLSTIKSRLYTALKQLSMKLKQHDTKVATR